ncbi:peptidase S51 [Candidatus Peregrinibacteria bacterium HGW-Peregrinibacteria-1]|jgi:dipeptidase E|nr:MAG: peptidase S51 [Candidatus Peregrinibacteria bacterium HGW-Peregrinibacteria-1]
MKKLFLHSDQIDESTQLDQALLKIFSGTTPKIGYIPSQSDPTRHFFKRKIEWYQQFGIPDLFYFDLDEEYDEDNIPKLLSCDAIFLSGGNTFTFLSLLKKRSFIPILRQFVDNGGILIGLSAGSILMSESIATTTIDADISDDQNCVGLTDLSALALNNFDFFPHFDGNNEIKEKLKTYSKESGKTIYACNDGDGIFVDGKDLHFFGEVWAIKDGKITPAV